MTFYSCINGNIKFLSAGALSQMCADGICYSNVLLKNLYKQTKDKEAVMQFCLCIMEEMQNTIREIEEDIPQINESPSYQEALYKSMQIFGDADIVNSLSIEDIIAGILDDDYDDDDYEGDDYEEGDD